MKAVDIIKETVKYYETHPRGIDGSSCLYLAEDGAMCAVGRCLTKKSLKQAVKLGSSFENLVLQMDVIFYKKYQGQSAEFWNDLQDFHDDGFNWVTTADGNKLSWTGLKELKVLLEQYAND